MPWTRKQTNKGCTAIDPEREIELTAPNSRLLDEMIAKIEAALLPVVRKTIHEMTDEELEEYSHQTSQPTRQAEADALFYWTGKRSRV
jgi:hypothetical protein